MRATLSKTTFRWALILGIFGVFAAWIWVLLSPEYANSKAALLRDDTVGGAYGEIQWTILYGFRLRYGDRPSNSFRFIVVGAKKTGTVETEGVMRDGEWLVRVKP